MSHYASWSPQGATEWFNPQGNANYRIVVMDDRGVQDVDSKYSDEALFLDVFIRKEDLEGEPAKHPEEVRTWTVNVGKTESSKYGQLRKVLMKWLRKKKEEVDEDAYYQLLEERLGTTAVEEMLKEQGKEDTIKRLLDEGTLTREKAVKGIGLKGFQIEIATQGTGKDKNYFIKRPEGKEVLYKQKLKELKGEAEKAVTGEQEEKLDNLLNAQGSVALYKTMDILDLESEKAKDYVKEKQGLELTDQNKVVFT